MYTVVVKTENGKIVTKHSYPTQSEAHNVAAILHGMPRKLYTYVVGETHRNHKVSNVLFKFNTYVVET